MQKPLYLQAEQPLSVMKRAVLRTSPAVPQPMPPFSGKGFFLLLIFYAVFSVLQLGMYGDFCPPVRMQYESFVKIY